MPELNCAHCNNELYYTERQIGDGLCHICGHKSLVQMRERVGGQLAEIEQLQEKNRQLQLRLDFFHCPPATPPDDDSDGCN